MAVQAVTDKTFESTVLRSELPVLVDLYADWCQPCKQIAPIMEELSRELDGKLRVVKVDVDKNPLVAQSFRVQSIPMMVVIAKGQVANHHIGALDKKGILKLVEPFLPTDAAEIKPADLAQLLTRKRAVPVDIRDAQAFARYRIPGAVNVPKAEIDTRAKELAPRDGRVRILYARSTDEAKEVAEKLRSAGVEVGYLAGGFLHWEADRLPIERG
jgi:thioredoxin 1